MKNRNINHQDDWATPNYFLDIIKKEYGNYFDPCPLHHDITKWDGLKIEWKDINFVNPPYSRVLKEKFVQKAIIESKKGKLCILLLPVSTSTKLFHKDILPNAIDIKFIEKRIKFIGINTKGEYVNWNLLDTKLPTGVVHVKNNGMHDSMLVTFNGGSLN